MKLGTLLQSLAKKAGVDTTQKEFVDLLSTDVEIPDAIATSIDKNLMDKEAAKVNQEVIKDIRTKALNGVDAKVAELLTELGIEDAADITDEKNSYEKVAKLTRKVKELESKKAAAGKNTDKDAIEKQIADLNKELKAQKDALATKEKEFAETRNTDLTNFEIQKKLLGKEYALPKEMNADLKVNTAHSAVTMALQAKGFKIVRDENGQLKILNKENLPAYSETNEPIQLDSFIDGALAQNKLLKVNDQGQGGGGNNGNDQIILPGGGGKGNPNTVSAIDSQMKELGLAS